MLMVYIAGEVTRGVGMPTIAFLCDSHSKATLIKGSYDNLKKESPDAAPRLFSIRLEISCQLSLVLGRWLMHSMQALGRHLL